MSEQVPVFQLRRVRPDNTPLDGVIDLVDPENLLERKTFTEKVEGWVTDDSINPVIGTIPANSLIVDAAMFVEEAFDSSTTDLLSVGTQADPDGFVADEDVSATGKKAPTLGVLEHVLVDTPVEALYTPGGTAATTGRAYVSVAFVRLPPIPA